MSLSYSSWLSLIVLSFAVFSFLLQSVSLGTSWWAIFSARVDLGKPREEGHYGLWMICSNKAPLWIEDCDPLDTFFRAPSLAPVSGVLGIVHLLLLIGFMTVGSLRAIQVVKDAPEIGPQPKTLCMAKLALAFVSVIFATFVAIFASIGEKRQQEYVVRKEWSFWLQIIVIGSDIVINLMCVAESVHFWRYHMQQQIDPDGKRAETYGNPVFDPGSPDLSDQNSTNGSVSVTESSGHLFQLNSSDFCVHAEQLSHNGRDESQSDRSQIMGESSAFPKPFKKRFSKKDGKLPDVLTFENESFQETSPRRARKNGNVY